MHLADWPDAAALPADAELVRGHGPGARGLLGGAVAARGPRPAGPPAAAVGSPSPAATPPSSTPFADSSRDEVNVKEVELTDDLAVGGQLRAAAQRQGARAQARRRRAEGHQGRPGRRLDAERRRHRDVAGHVLERGRVRAGARPPRRRRRHRRRCAATTRSSTSTSRSPPELPAEGTARDLVRLVQQARKDADLDVTDRIELTVQAATGSRPPSTPTSTGSAARSWPPSPRWAPSPVTTAPRAASTASRSSSPSTASRSAEGPPAAPGGRRSAPSGADERGADPPHDEQHDEERRVGPLVRRPDPAHPARRRGARHGVPRRAARRGAGRHRGRLHRGRAASPARSGRRALSAP